jgi:FRG domain-containing protein
MALTFVEKPWEKISAADGVVTYRLKSWPTFYDFLETKVFEIAGFAKENSIWRGQRRSDWSLSTSLDRLFGKLGRLGAGSAELEERAKKHLEAFKYAARGRRGLNPAELTENDWWSLGQHFDLATPLLDWTRSPFAAAYFAFEQLAADTTDHTDHRAVYGLDMLAVSQRNKELVEEVSFERGRQPLLEFIDPMTDENQRLVSQGGLFTRTPIGVSVNEWIEKAFEGLSASVLLRIEIPDADRLKCLRATQSNEYHIHEVVSNRGNFDQRHSRRYTPAANSPSLPFRTGT